MITSILLYAFIVILTYIFYKIYLRPQYLLSFYHKQGLDMKFYTSGSGKLQVKYDFEEHGDAFYSFRQSMKNGWRGFGYNSGSFVCLVLNDPKLIKEFLHQQQNYIKPDEFYYIFKLFVGDGLIFIDHKRWKQHRTTFSTIFHYDYLRSYVPQILKVGDQMLDEWKMNKDALKNFNFRENIAEITGQVVGRLFFGQDFRKFEIEGLSYMKNDQKWTKIVLDTTVHPVQLLLGPQFIQTRLLSSHRDIFRYNQLIFKLASNTIRERFDMIKKQKAQGTYNPEYKTLFDLFFEKSLENLDSATFYKFTEKEMIHEFYQFFSAGASTTSHLITMAAYYYSANPQYQQRLSEEIESVFGNGKEVTIEDLNKMEFMTCFLKETLRIFGPSSTLFDRKALHDHKIGDLSIKKDTLICINTVGLHLSDKYYEEPDLFNPYRWLDENSMTRQTIKENPYVYLPFSGGQRNCIGQNFAMNSAKVIFSQFIRKFNFNMSDPNYVMKINDKVMREPEDPILFDIREKFEKEECL